MEHLPPEEVSTEEHDSTIIDDVLHYIQENDVSITPVIKIIKDETDDTSSTTSMDYDTNDNQYQTSTLDEQYFYSDTDPVIKTIAHTQIALHHDSGANRSVTNNLDLLHNIENLATPYVIKGASESYGFLTCTQKGMLNIVCKDESIITVPVNIIAYRNMHQQYAFVFYLGKRM